MYRDYYEVDEAGEIVEVYSFNPEFETVPEHLKEGWGGDRGIHRPVFDFTLNDWKEGRPATEVLAHSKNNKLNEFKRRTEEEIASQFTATNGDSYDFELKDQTNFSQLLSLLIVDETMSEVDYPTKNKGVRAHTKAEFIQVAKDAEAHKNRKKDKYYGLKQRVENATTEEELEAIMWEE